MNLGNIDLNKLNVFRELALSGSFTKAALKLKSPKSRVSRVISSLEKDLGVQLIHRTTRQFQLTGPGVLLSEHLNTMMRDLSSTLEQTISQTQEISGVIRVTSTNDISTELLGKICREFNAIYPQVVFTVLSSTSVIDLVEQKIDIAIRVGKVKDSTMIQRPLGRVDLSLVMSPSFFQKHSVKNIDDLQKLPYITYEGIGQKTLSYKMNYRHESKTLRSTPVFISNNFFLIRDMAIKSVGYAFIPSFLARDHVAKGELISVFKEWKVEGLPIQILFPAQKEIPARVRKFVDFITPKLMNYF